MATTSDQQRQGLLAGGNFIIDHVKIIDAWPAEQMLANIATESSANGGGPYNILKDLAKLGAKFPLEAAGLVGHDSDGDWILADCKAHNIDTTQLQQTTDAHTSYTDAMTVAATGRRTFFHQQGANALIDTAHFDFTRTNTKIFHLAYLMLLRTLDRLEPDNTTTPAAKVLAAAKSAGLVTTCDIVSTDAPEFRDVALAAIPHIDHLVINELEAGSIAGDDLRPGGRIDIDRTRTAARRILDHGVNTRVIIHFEEGAVAVSKDGDTELQPSLDLPQDFIKGATGAGDAFAAGYLYGLHEDLPLDECLRHAVCLAAICLSDPTTSNGIQPLESCLALAPQFGFRTFP